MEQNKKPIIGILMGDASGVGPELVAILAAEQIYQTYCRPVVIGDARILQMGASVRNLNVPMQIISEVGQATWADGIPVLDQKDLDPAEITYGELNTASGKSCLDALKLGVELFQAKEIDGFCFAPLNKTAMKQAGCKFESEHHYLANLLHHTEPFGEINMVENVWTTRTTSHIPICEVSQNLSVQSILRAIKLAYTTLKNAGYENPKIGLAALNPHAGEHGLCGREEIDVITPAIEEAKKLGITAIGPYPSDTLFIKAFEHEFDGVVTMYHDQGQIALKLRGFDQGITIAGGLPIPIATCGHGTAYDIAGKGVVKSTAFENAVKMTAQMALHLQR